MLCHVRDGIGKHEVGWLQDAADIPSIQVSLDVQLCTRRTDSFEPDMHEQSGSLHVAFLNMVMKGARKSDNVGQCTRALVQEITCWLCPACFDV